MRWMPISLLACILSAANLLHASPPSQTDTSALTDSRLEAILQRLEAIEKRLSALEEIDRRRSRFWIDKNGVIRLPSGEPAGFWGIDDPRRSEAR